MGHISVHAHASRANIQNVIGEWILKMIFADK